MAKIDMEQFKDDVVLSMDRSYEELRRILYPVFHDKTKYVNGKLLKDCFRHFGDIIKSHHLLRGQLK